MSQSEYQSSFVILRTLYENPNYYNQFDIQKHNKDESE